MEELQKRWSAWIDQRVAAAMADAIKTVADSIGEVIAKERERTRNEIKAAIAVSQGEMRVAIAEGKSMILEHLSVRLDNRFDSLQRQIMDVFSDRVDGPSLRRLPAPATRQ